MRTTQRKSNPTNKITIVKNKEIIIYKNGEEFKHFKQSETKDLTDNEMFILDYLLKKYSGYEVPNRSSNENDSQLKFSGRRNVEISQTQKLENTNDFFGEDDDKKTEPKLREFFEDIENEDQEGMDEMVKEEVTEIKKLKKGTKTTEEQKVPIQNRNKNNVNYHYEEQIVDAEENEEEESEESPQYIIELESYTSPTFKFIDEKRAEYELINGIKCSLMINGEEKKGILFLGKNGKIIFISFDSKETEIDLYNIKRIYFNIKGSDNLRNYTKKSNDERFIQIIELNNRKTDFKFNNNDDLEYFIKGLISAYKSKASTIDKSIMYQRIKEYAPYEEKNVNIYKSENNRNKIVESTYKKEETNYDKGDNNNYYEKYNYEYTNKNTYRNNINPINNRNPDDIVTTTKVEVFKDGKLINEETKEESHGVVKTLHSYSPDISEYEEYLRKSKLGKSLNNSLNKSIDRIKKTYV